MANTLHRNLVQTEELNVLTLVGLGDLLAFEYNAFLVDMEEMVTPEGFPYYIRVDKSETLDTQDLLDNITRYGEIPFCCLRAALNDLCLRGRLNPGNYLITNED